MKKGKKRREKREAKNGIVVKKRENILFPCFIKALMTAIKSPQKNREEFQTFSRRGEGCFWVVIIYTPGYIIKPNNISEYI